MTRIVAIAFVGMLTCFVAPAAHAQQKTIKACHEEWRANKAANQAAGKTAKAYVAECRSTGAKQDTAKKPESAKADPAKPAAAKPEPAKPAEKPAAATQKTTQPKAAIGATGANQYATEAQAKARCPSDIVVWVNLSSKIYHFTGNKAYGTTKSGTYMCEKETSSVGARAAKNEKRPGA